MFALRGVVDWRAAIPMLLAAIVGGYIGAHTVKRLNAEVVRKTVLVYAWVTSIWLLIRSL
jgi:uncharacterized membrane protein YfcA